MPHSPSAALLALLRLLHKLSVTCIPKLNSIEKQLKNTVCNCGIFARLSKFAGCIVKVFKDSAFFHVNEC